MQPENSKKNQNIMLAIAGAVLLMLFLFVSFGSRGSNIFNPYTDKNLEGDMGKTFSVLYGSGDLYKLVGENDEILRNIQEDLFTFAKTTRPEFTQADSLVAFTITKQLDKEGDGSVFIGQYYGVKDDIKLIVTPEDKGVYILSITNQNDQTNIDEFLGMNGPRTRYIASLPVQKSGYSIRYQLVEDRVVATFYAGYTAQDVSEVEQALKAGLGENFETETAFSINGLGIFDLGSVKQNLITPLKRR